jgi:predicted DNA-binding antitoxin AbrB/MazE fold protein
MFPYAKCNTAPKPGVTTMQQIIRARYHNGRIEPLEKLNLANDTELTIIVPKARKQPKKLSESEFSLEGMFTEGDPIPKEAIDEVTK